MTLPYANSKANPAQAQERIRKTLMKFGVSRISFDEDFEKRIVIVKFTYKNFPITMPVDYGRLAEVYMKEDPWSYRKRGFKVDWEAQKREIAHRASYSLLDDYIKSMVTMVSMGISSFEEVFLSHFTGPTGLRLGDVLVKRLPEYTETGQLALEGGEVVDAEVVE